MRQFHPAWRALCRRPVYALTSVLLLTLGIGATTALFSVVDTILLEALPYPNADRLVTLAEASPSKGRNASLIAPARLEDWNRMSRSFEAVAGQYSENVTDTSGAEPERLASRRVSPRLFEVYGAAAILGRTFTPEEERFGGPSAAVLSDGLWARRFGRQTSALGKAIRIGGIAYTIVGVMPKEFAPPAVDLWLPAQFSPEMLRLRPARFLLGVGRLRAGVTRQQAQADLARVERELAQQFPQTDRDWSALVGDLKEYRVGSYRRTLWLVFGAVGLLLSIGVANIAGLTLAQLQLRERELAIRCSIGASRAQVIATVVREVLLIAASGAVFGTLLSRLVTSLLAASFADLPRMVELQFNWRALAFALGASLAASLIFGAVPALHATRADLAGALAEGSRTVSGGRRRLQRGFVVAQLGITVLLLASAGLLLRSYYKLTRADYGFDTADTITFHVAAAWDENRTRNGELQRQIIDRLEAFPGVEAAGFSSFLPATNATLNFPVAVEGIAGNDGTGGAISSAGATNDGTVMTFMAGQRTIGGDYLRALHIPLLAGEWCPPLEPFAINAAQRTLVNRRFVDLYLKGRSVVGRHTYYPQSGWPNPPANTIVGVVGDVREDGLSSAPAPYVYDCSSAGSFPDPEYVVRTRGDARALMQHVSEIVHGVDPGRAVFGVKMLDRVLDDALEQPRLNARFLAVFSAMATLLASVGVYSLVTLIVTSRTREIGVRIALGADHWTIMREVFSGAGRLVGAGVALGLGLTAAVEQLLRSSLFEVSPLDAPTLAGATILLIVVATLAALLPARRAASIDPLHAMRGE